MYDELSDIIDIRNDFCLVPLIDGVPQHIRPANPNEQKAFVHGYICCFTAIHELLLRDVIPTPAAVRKEIVRLGFQMGCSRVGHFRAYEKMGDRIEFALDGLLQRVEGSWIDGSFMEGLDEVEYAALPRCVTHDMDFGRARSELLG